MEKNEGRLDRALRAIVGLALIVAAGSGLIGPWGWVGILPLGTAVIGWCPLYKALGIDTCRF